MLNPTRRLTVVLALGFSCLSSTLPTPANTPGVHVAGVALSDNGDDDGFADTNETVSLHVRLRNNTGLDLTGVAARLFTEDPKIECILQPVDALADLPIMAIGETTFRFKVGTVDRASVDEAFSVEFGIRLSSAEALDYETTFTLDLDLDPSGGATPTFFFEDFEGAGLGAFTTMELDAGLGGSATDGSDNDNSDDYRCQYTDPDWVNSNSSGTGGPGHECYLNPTGQPDAFYWHVTTDRAYSGLASLYFGVEETGHNPSTPIAQLEAVRTTAPVNLGWEHVCADSRHLTCSDASDCPGAESCVPTMPTLSFKHQISLFHQFTSNDPGSAIDRAVVMARQLDPGGAPQGDWFVLEPFQNIHDGASVTIYSNCRFDPVDDGNDEDSFFDPADPERRFGPSSTCYPAAVFHDVGETFRPFDPDAVGGLGPTIHGPGLQGTGMGTWVESIYDLSRLRGRRLELRFLETGMKLGSSVLWEHVFAVGVDDEEGWFIDDVHIGDTLASPAMLAVDLKDNSGLPGLDDADGDGLVCDNCPSLYNDDQLDFDLDNIGDACDFCPLESPDDADGDGVCCPQDNCCDLSNSIQSDLDLDGVGDACDNCPAVPNPDQADTIHPDGIGDACDDPDGDGILDVDDNCPDLASGDRSDTDGDGRGDLCDNCATAHNRGQVDDDGDGLGNACDACPGALPVGDADGDGTDDGCDNCPGLANVGQADWDQDGLGDACDDCPDGDGDGFRDRGLSGSCPVDNCVDIANPTQADSDGDNVGDACDGCGPNDFDDDGDGLCASVDNCPQMINENLSLRITQFADIADFRVTPDDRTLIVEYEPPGPTGLHVLGIGDRSVPRKIGDGSILAVSPDSSRIAVLSDDGRLLSVHLGGTATVELAPSVEVEVQVTFSPDGSRVVYCADDDGDGNVELLSVPSDGGLPQPLSVNLFMGGAIPSLEFAGDGTTLVYTADQDHFGVDDLYRIAVSGGVPTRLSDMDSLLGDVHRFIIDDDDSRIVYSADQNVDGIDELFSVSIDGSVPVRLNRPLLPGAKILDFDLDAGDGRVVYLADLDVPSRFELYSVPVNGGSSIRLNGALAPNRDVTGFLLSPTGGTATYRADQDGDQTFELYAVPTAGGTPLKLNGPLLGGDDVVEEWVIAPDGSRVVYGIDTPDSAHWYSVSISGGGSIELIGIDELPVISADSTTVFLVSRSNFNNQLRIDVDSILGGSPANLTQNVRGDTPLGAGNRIYWRDIATDDFTRAAVYFYETPTDGDGDGLLDVCDDCPEVNNTNQRDRDRDGFGQLCECADLDGTIYPGAPEINDGQDNQCAGEPGFGSVDEGSTDSGFTDPAQPDHYRWTAQPGATGYQVARAEAADFSSDCTIFDLAGTVLVDPALPPADTVFFYLNRAAEPGEGSWGLDSTGAERLVPCAP